MVTDTLVKGFRRDDVNLVNSYLPKTGKAVDSAAEDWRLFQNAYVAYHKNGIKPDYNAMRSLAKGTGVVWKQSNRDVLFEDLGIVLLDRFLQAIHNDTLSGEPRTPLFKVKDEE